MRLRIASRARVNEILAGAIPEAGQTVNPFTGQTVARSDPFWHWEWGS